MDTIRTKTGLVSFAKIVTVFTLMITFSGQLQAQQCAHTDRNSWTWPGHTNWFLPKWSPSDGASYIYNQKTGATTKVKQTNWNAPNTQTTSIRGYQGIAAASDDNGKLIFFTNGRKAWKADGTLITNKILQGNECGSVADRGSAVHGCMILRHPLQPLYYYIVAIDDIVNQGCPNNGITYAIIDSSGNLVQNSQSIETNISSGKLGKLRTTETMAATLHGNGVDIWITFQPLNKTYYVTYLLTCDGFVTPAVKSANGMCTPTSIMLGNGDIDFNQAGTQMGAGVHVNQADAGAAPLYGYGTLNLYDFDNWTGEISNRKAVFNKQWGTSIIYNVLFSADGAKLHYAGQNGDDGMVNTSGSVASIRNSHKPSNRLTGGYEGAAMNMQGQIESRDQTNAKAGVSGPMEFGSNDMYIPPLEEPDMQEIGPFCDTSETEDIHTYWLCSGVSAEDTLLQRHSYKVLDPNDPTGATTHPNSASIVGEKTGIFDPTAADVGMNRVVFTYCGVNDTMDVEVIKCPACKAKLKDVTPRFCVGDEIALDTMIIDATGTRTWTIDSFPTYGSTFAFLNITGTDTLFDANDVAIKSGTYKLKLEGTFDGGETCYDTMYVTVDSLPLPDLGNDTSVCADWNPVTFDAGVYASYDWGPDGGNVQTITKLESKVFSVMVTDDNGCEGADMVELTINPLPTAVLPNDTFICAGDDPIDFNAALGSTGGDGSAITSYVWNDAQTGDTKTTDVDGLYWVAIEDANMCADTDSVILTVHALPDVELRTDTSICDGDAALTFEALNPGANDSIYTWSTGETGPSIQKDTAGIYKVVLMDKFGCLDSDEVELTINPLPEIDLRDSIICQGAPAVLWDATAVLPGMARYNWNGVDGAGDFTTDVDGEYYLIVEDNFACSDTDTVRLTVNLFVPVEIGPDTAICFGAPKVVFDAGIEQANLYSWMDAVGTPLANTQTFETSTDGKYYLALQDSNGCPGADSIVLTVNPLPTVDLGNDTAICEGDPAVTFDAGNAGVGMQYTWSSTETSQTIQKYQANEYWVAIEDVNGCTDTDSVVLTVHGLPVVDLGADREICQAEDSVTFDAGHPNAQSWVWDHGPTTQVIKAHFDPGASASDETYTVTVTDSNGCVQDTFVVLTINPMPSVSIRDSSVCEDAPDVVFDIGATFDTYAWSNGGSGQTEAHSAAGIYNVTFSSAAGCQGTDTFELIRTPLPVPDLGADRTICADATAETFDPGTFEAYSWSSGESSQTISTTTAAVYTVEVTDAAGCKASDDVELIVIDLPNPDVIFDMTKCPGSTATLDASVYDNGNGPFTYAWHDGSTGSSYSTTAEENVWVDVTDSYGCVGRDLASITDKSNLTVSIVGAPTIDLCEGENVDLIPNYKAVDGYNFTWSGDASGTTETINVSQSGTYNLHVDNGGGCEGDGTIDVIVHPLPVLTPNPAAICDGASATIGDNLGGTYTYVWSTGESTPTISVTTAGNYNVEVTSNQGCVSEMDINVTVNSNPTPDLGNDVEACEGVLVNLTDRNHQNGQTYAWSTGETTDMISPTVSGTYSLTVTSSVGCVGSDDVDIVFIPIPTVDLGPDIVLCEGESAVVDAGNLGLDILWMGGETTNQITVSQAGDYTVFVSQNGCNATDVVNVEIVAMPESEIDHSLALNPYCFDEIQDRGITIEAGSNDGYDYLWGTGETSKEITVFGPGTFNVQITVGNCTVEDRITLRDFCPSTIYVPNTFTPDGDGINDRFFAYGTYLSDFEMYVYNRWGEQIFESNDQNVGWDGTYMGNEVQIDTYVWKVYYSVNHEDGTLRKKQKVGIVNVLR